MCLDCNIYFLFEKQVFNRLLEDINIYKYYYVDEKEHFFTEHFVILTFGNLFLSVENNSDDVTSKFISTFS